MTISIIAAIAKNKAIGKDNDLIWYLSEDLKRFKKLTSNHTIIMGRRTFESFPVKPLPNRKNVIITRQKDYSFKEEEGGKIIVDHKKHILLDDLKSIPNNILFNNNDHVFLNTLKDKDIHVSPLQLKK